MYPDVLLYIGGEWVPAQAGGTLPIHNPSTGDVLGSVAHAQITDLDSALAAAEQGFRTWREVPALERAGIMRTAGALLRQRADEIARLMSLELGKPLLDAHMEVIRGAETCEWMAGEAQRAYGRIIPARAPGERQLVLKEPMGPVAAFTPWNFPVNQIVRKVAGALAAGCSIIVKGPEETPASCAELVRAFGDAGVSSGALNLVYGTPAHISEYLIPSPVIRKVSFTGSTAVGKQLAALAGLHMKPVTMELGGHAPVLVFDDVEVEEVARISAANKWRNAGQSCVTPTRFLVQRGIYERFTEAVVESARSVKLGDGLSPDTAMGPMANPRRVEAMEALVADALERGGRLRAGGRRLQRPGYFFEPTVLTDVPPQARVMNEEPFGPLALIQPFDDTAEALREANRIPYGLAAYVFTRSAARAQALTAKLASGMVSVNHFGLGLPETPFGGMRDSGYGFEGGSEAIEAYLQTRFVTEFAPEDPAVGG